MRFRWATETFETPWEALVGAWQELTRCADQERESLRQQAGDCDRATRLVSTQEDAGGLPEIYDTQGGNDELVRPVPFEWDEHIAAVMEAAERTLSGQPDRERV